MYTTNKATRSIADAALKVMMDEAKSPAQQAAIAIAMKEKGQKPKEEMKEALHPNQQKLDVHEPEKDELTAKDFEMLRKGKKAPVKKVTEGTNVTDYNPKSQGGTRKELLVKYHSTKDPKDAEAARKAGATQKELRGVAEGTIAGDILKKIDEMKGPWPGTPEYKKKFPEREMKPGEEKATKTGIVKKTIKGVVHTAKPMKEEVEIKQEEPQVKVLAKEEVSFQNLIDLYMDNGVESLLQTMEKLKEESTNDEFTKEVEEHKKKAEGKVEQPEVSKGAVKAVAVTKEEVEQLDELKKDTLKSYVSKATDSSRTMPGYGTKTEKSKKTMRHIGISRATEKLAKEEVELDEASYSAKAARAGEDIGKPGKMFDVIAKKAGERYGSIERGKKVAGALLAKLRKEEVEELTDEQLETIFEQIDIQLNERSMTEPEMKKREEIVKSMKKNLAGFKERYGEKAKSVMYATATKQAMKD